jgi:hypothetical protein
MLETGVLGSKPALGSDVDDEDSLALQVDEIDRVTLQA